MYEVLSRRFRRARELQAGKGGDDTPGTDAADTVEETVDQHEGDKSTWALPDLIVIDGGKGQLGMALAAARDIGIDVRPGVGLPIVGLAKERDVAVPDEDEDSEDAEAPAAVAPAAEVPDAPPAENSAGDSAASGETVAPAATEPAAVPPPADDGVPASSKPTPKHPDRVFLPHAKDAIPIRPNTAVGERSVPRRAEVPAPRLHRVEHARVAERHVDAPVGAGREPRDGAGRGGRREREMAVGPRQDVLQDVVLPGAGPLAVELRCGARRGHDRDEGRHLARADEPIGDGREPEAPDEAVGRSPEPVQEHECGVAPCAQDAWGQVDERCTREGGIGGIRDHSLPDRSARGPLRDERPARGRHGGRHAQRVVGGRRAEREGERVEQTAAPDGQARRRDRRRRGIAAHPPQGKRALDPAHDAGRHAAADRDAGADPRAGLRDGPQRHGRVGAEADHGRARRGTGQRQRALRVRDGACERAVAMRREDDDRELRRRALPRQLVADPGDAEGARELRAVAAGEHVGDAHPVARLSSGGEVDGADAVDRTTAVGDTAARAVVGHRPRRRQRCGPHGPEERDAGQRGGECDPHPGSVDSPSAARRTARTISSGVLSLVT